MVVKHTIIENFYEPYADTIIEFENETTFVGASFCKFNLCMKIQQIRAYVFQCTIPFRESVVYHDSEVNAETQTKG